VKLYHIQECLSGAPHILSQQAWVSVSDRASEQHSADSNKTLRLHSNWQTCNCSYEIAAELSLDIGCVDSNNNFKVSAW